MQGSIQRPGFIAKFVLAAALLVAGGFAVITTTDARADTQYYSGSYYGKTYRNNWGDYQTSTIPSYAYCGGGAWGGTYNDSVSVQKRVSLWRDSLEMTAWGWYDWVYKGYSHGYSSGYAGAETNVYQGHCTRASSDHYYWNGSSWVLPWQHQRRLLEPRRRTTCLFG